MNNKYWLSGWKMGWQNPEKVNRTRVKDSLIKHFPALGLKKGATLLVPLCGKSIDLIWLAQQQINVVGVELSEIPCLDFLDQHKLPYVYEESKKFKVFKAKNIQLWCGDFFDFKKYYRYEINGVYDNAALVALPKKMQKSYVEYLASICEPNTRILLNSFETDAHGNLYPPFSVDRAQIEELYKPFFTIKKLSQTNIVKSARLLPKGKCNLTKNVTYLLERI